MPALNLAALTTEELQALLGEEGAQSRLPDVSRARLEGRPLLGPLLPAALTFEPLAERPWGATPEESRRLTALDAELRAAGAEPLGVYYVPQERAARHLRAYLFGPEVAAALRWSETPELPRSGQPFVEAVTWLRDRASGVACVFSTSAAAVPVPAPSEAADVRVLPGASPTELLTLHRRAVLHHGRGGRIHGEEGWKRAWQELHALNMAAWARRGLLLHEAEG
ncbi:hypothetical protein [Deinococcus sp. YIM 77859]|uniref:hypothetical protein n=1 Tax=Deinococcus sp. YIM 77859 TaxID=1540221 RepID=UPI001E5D7E2E|nr:hypothetical protein [Deinococcus sp. YIM 77859]